MYDKIHYNKKKTIKINAKVLSKEKKKKQSHRINYKKQFVITKGESQGQGGEG